ncbi:hypothetical protein T440DRAFT_523870 [Plenodomus tracheiphilus IPT5]|uniref:F-box domain-containing protein n=1 Tax=Plenodomus tracheiphilus IPT5 TaxID=1408161 RepID=A0A6A7AML5_9PLEO|nr:hypothetical protein T440DRAFT_523870 [Plenodomus tracheiphilus IPT5]
MPKQTSRRNPTKAPSGQYSPKSNTKLENNEDPAPMLDAVEVIGLTCLVGEGDSGVNGSGRGREGDVGSYDDSVRQNENEGKECMQIFRRCTGEESPNQPVPSGDIFQEVVIENGQPNSDTDAGDFRINDARMQKGDQLGVLSSSTLECYEGVCPTDMGAVAKATSSGSSDTDDDDDDHGNQTARLTSKRKRLSSIQPPDTISRRDSRQNAPSKKQRKLTTSGGNPLSNGSSALIFLTGYGDDNKPGKPDPPQPSKCEELLSPPSRFLNLPRELRNIIYGYCQIPIDLTQGRFSKCTVQKTRWLSLAQVCKKTREEFRPLRLKTVVIVVRLSKLMPCAGNLLRQLPRNTAVTLKLHEDRIYEEPEQILAFLCSTIRSASLKSDCFHFSLDSSSLSAECIALVPVPVPSSLDLNDCIVNTMGDMEYLFQ